MQAEEEYYLLSKVQSLSAPEVYTISKIQQLWALCAKQLKVADQLFMLSIILELDGNEEFLMLMMMHVHHCMHNVKFLSSLDNLLMEITSDQVIPCLVPVNRNCTFDLLHPGSCYEKTHFRVAQLRSCTIC
jgi:hypothetical protein